MKKLFPDSTILETKYFTVAQDWEVAIIGFYIISPKRKVQGIAQFTDKEYEDYVAIVRKVRKAMLTVLKIKAVYFFQNEDTPHNFHLWMLPRYSWMDKVVKPGPGSLVPVWRYARDHLETAKEIKKVERAAEKMRKYLAKP